jgi:hypothetical protein
MTNAVVGRSINQHGRWCQAHVSVRIWFPVSKPQVNKHGQINGLIVDRHHQQIQIEPCNSDAST